MIKSKRQNALIKNRQDVIVGVDETMGLYDLTDIFYTGYKYHNEELLLGSRQLIPTNTSNSTSGKVNNPNAFPVEISRFGLFRKLESMYLGSRPFDSSESLAAHRPNVSMGYFRTLIDYVTLPLKSTLTDSSLARIQFNKKLFNEEHLSDIDKDELKLNAANNPNLSSNKEISDDISDAFVACMRASKKINTCFDFIPKKFSIYAFVALLHSDLDWQPTPIDPLDLITEPMATYDPSTWNSFFIIRKMTISEITAIIRNEDKFWNIDALKWAIYSASQNKGILNSNHYTGATVDYTTQSCGENFMVRSFTREKATRSINVGNYYGNMLVVEGYYINKDGKVDKVIFFPSSDFLNTPKSVKRDRLSLDSNTRKEYKHLEKANVLFHRQNIFDKMRDAITIIPANRDELSLERQRFFGHELANPVEMIMRLDSSILNFATLMGTPFTKNRLQGSDSQNLEDMEIAVNGDMIDLGDRDFVETPFTADLQGMMGVRNALLQHAMSKAFLGGLDGAETMSNGRGASLANLRLIRDARIHKHIVESFSKGLQELYTKILLRILKMSDKLLNDDVIVQKLFFDTLENLHGYPKELLEFSKDEVIPDTGLPYWMDVTALRNGGSHFGAAELVLYSEIKQVFGDALDQKSMTALNRIGIKSLLGSQDSFDILGDPKDNLVTDKDQIYLATLETASIIGSVDSGALSFESIPVLEDKDDHVAHLTQVHNPKAMEFLEALQNVETSPESLASMSDQQLETHNNLVLKLGALANHIAEHAGQLNRFGDKRPDINKLKEETNSILQSSEGLMQSLKVTLRSLQERQADAQLKMQSLSPENQADQAKAQLEMQKLQVKSEENRNKLMLANKISDQNQQQHRDTQVNKAKDRQAKVYMNDRMLEEKKQKNLIDAQIKLATAKISASKKPASSSSSSK
jgi:hypothetical protein